MTAALTTARAVLDEVTTTSLRDADRALLARLLDTLVRAATELLDEHGDHCVDPHQQHGVLTARTRTVVREAVLRPRPAPDLMTLAMHIGMVTGVLRLLVDHVEEVGR